MANRQETFHPQEDKEILKKRLELLQQEYERTAQRLQRAERRDAMRKHVQSRIAEQNTLMHVEPNSGTSDLMDATKPSPLSASCSLHPIGQPLVPQTNPDIERRLASVDTPGPDVVKRVLAVRFHLPDKVEGQAVASPAGKRSAVHRLRSRRSRLRLQSRERELNSQEKESEGWRDGECSSAENSQERDVEKTENSQERDVEKTENSQERDVEKTENSQERDVEKTENSQERDVEKTENSQERDVEKTERVREGSGERKWTDVTMKAVDCNAWTETELYDTRACTSRPKERVMDGVIGTEGQKTGEQRKSDGLADQDVVCEFNSSLRRANDPEDTSPGTVSDHSAAKISSLNPAADKIPSTSPLVEVKTKTNNLDGKISQSGQAELVHLSDPSSLTTPEVQNTTIQSTAGDLQTSQSGTGMGDGGTTSVEVTTPEVSPSSPGGRGLLESCTLIEGLLYPVEYYIRTTRRMAAAQSSVDLDAVIQSKLTGGRGRRRSSQSQTPSRGPTNSERPESVHRQVTPGRRGRRTKRGRGQRRSLATRALITPDEDVDCPHQPDQCSENHQNSEPAILSEPLILSDPTSETLPHPHSQTLTDSEPIISSEPHTHPNLMSGSGDPVTSKPHQNFKHLPDSQLYLDMKSLSNSNVYPIFHGRRGLAREASGSQPQAPQTNGPSLHTSLGSLTQALRAKDSGSLGSLLRTFDLQDFHLPDEDFGRLKLEKLQLAATGFEAFTHHPSRNNTRHGNSRRSNRAPGGYCHGDAFCVESSRFTREPLPPCPSPSNSLLLSQSTPACQSQAEAHSADQSEHLLTNHTDMTSQPLTSSIDQTVHNQPEGKIEDGEKIKSPRDPENPKQVDNRQIKHMDCAQNKLEAQIANIPKNHKNSAQKKVSDPSFTHNIQQSHTETYWTQQGHTPTQDNPSTEQTAASPSGHQQTHLDAQCMVQVERNTSSDLQTRTQTCHTDTALIPYSEDSSVGPALLNLSPFLSSRTQRGHNLNLPSLGITPQLLTPDCSLPPRPSVGLSPGFSSQPRWLGTPSSMPEQAFRNLEAGDQGRSEGYRGSENKCQSQGSQDAGLPKQNGREQRTGSSNTSELQTKVPISPETNFPTCAPFGFECHTRGDSVTRTGRETHSQPLCGPEMVNLTGDCSTTQVASFGELTSSANQNADRDICPALDAGLLATRSHPNDDQSALGSVRLFTNEHHEEVTSVSKPSPHSETDGVDEEDVDAPPNPVLSDPRPRVLQHTHTVQALAEGSVLDVCLMGWPPEGWCLCVAGEWSVCVWGQKNSLGQWSLLHTWSFSQSVLSVLAVPDSPGLLCVTLGQLEMTEARVLCCPGWEGPFTEAALCEGMVHVVVGVSNCRLGCSSTSQGSQGTNVYTLSQDGRVVETVALASPGWNILSLAVVEGQRDALIGWTLQSILLIWNMKTGQLLQTVQLGQTMSIRTCMRGYSHRGALCVLLQSVCVSVEQDVALFCLIGLNPLTGKSIQLASITSPPNHTDRLIDGDVSGLVLAGVYQSGCLAIWDLAGGAAKLVEHEVTGACQLARWAGPNTLVTGHIDGNVNLYQFI